VGGSKTRRRTDRLLERVKALAEQTPSRKAKPLVPFTAGLVAFLQGRWAKAHPLIEEAATRYREHCTGVAWEVATAETYALQCRYGLGDLDAIRRGAPRLLSDARERGDVYAEVLTRLWIAFLHLVEDRPERVEAELALQADQWPSQSFSVQHWWELWVRIVHDLYQGRPGVALRRQQARWPAYERSLIHRVQFNRIYAWTLRGRVVLAAVASHPEERARLIKRASRDAACIEAEGASWAEPFADLLRGGVAMHLEKTAEALKYLDRSVAGHGAHGEELHAIVARHLRGRVRGGASGAAEVDAAEADLRSLGVACPARFARSLTF